LRSLGGNRSRFSFVGIMATIQVGVLVYRYLLAVTVGPELFGAVDAVVVTATLAANVGSLGMAAAVSHFASIFKLDAVAASRRIGTAVLINAGSLSIVTCISVLWLRSWENGQELQGFSANELYGVLAVALASSVALALTNGLVSLEQFSAASKANLFRVSTLLASVLVFAFFEAVAVIYWILAAVAIAWALQGLWSARRLLSLLPAMRPSVAVAREVLQFGLAAMLHATGSWTLLALDRVLLKDRVAEVELGRYSYAYLFAFSYTQVYLLANQAWRTTVYQLLADSKRSAAEVREFFLPARRLIATLAGLAMVSVPVVSGLLAPARFSGTGEIVVVLTLGAFWLGQYITTVNVVFFNSKLVALSLVSLTTGVLTGIPILLFVEEHGVIVAAWATAGGYFALFVFSTLIIDRLCNVSLGVGGAIAPGVALAVAAVLYDFNVMALRTLSVTISLGVSALTGALLWRSRRSQTGLNHTDVKNALE